MFSTTRSSIIGVSNMVQLPFEGNGSLHSCRGNRYNSPKHGHDMRQEKGKVCVYDWEKYNKARSRLNIEGC